MCMGKPASSAFKKEDFVKLLKHTGQDVPLNINEKAVKETYVKYVSSSSENDQYLAISNLKSIIVSPETDSLVLESIQAFCIKSRYFLAYECAHRKEKEWVEFVLQSVPFELVKKSSAFTIVN
jgi:hypothetical protein